MKVSPKNDTIRKLIKHPNGTAFPHEGPAEWPDDTFTFRRIEDGDVTVDKEDKEHSTAETTAAEKPAKTK